MSIEKMREEFEVWLKSVWLGASVARNPDDAAMFVGNYRDETVHYSWRAWQASRSALVIDLPDDGIEDCRKEWPERGEKYGYDTFDTGYLYACKKHEEAIEAAGVRTK